jgi:hypothetical protein
MQLYKNHETLGVQEDSEKPKFQARFQVHKYLYLVWTQMMYIKYFRTISACLTSSILIKLSTSKKGREIWQ